jgi:hypothetical protein
VTACRTCVFYDGAERLCRRTSPVIDPRFGSGWPTVEPGDWCGEHKTAEAKIEDARVRRILLATNEQIERIVLARQDDDENPS